MQFSEMQTEVFRRLEESSSSPVFWTLAQVKESINKGYRTISDATEWLETSGALTLSGTLRYNIPVVSWTYPLVLSVTGIRNGTTGRWMAAATTRELDEQYYKWETTTGAPYKYYLHCFAGSDIAFVLGFESDDSTSALTVYYTAIPADLSADADTPAFPQEFHLGLVDYAVYDCLCQDRENKKALYYWNRYLGREEGLGKYVRQRQGLDRIGVLG